MIALVEPCEKYLHSYQEAFDEYKQNDVQTYAFDDANAYNIFEKYDNYVPYELLRKAYAEDKLRADEPEEQIEASVEFLKWFTQDERNIQFSLDSGYMPVTKEANNLETIEKDTSLNETDRTFSIVKAAIDTVNHNTLYTTKAFENGKNARSILEYSMSDKAAEDRKTVVENLQKGQTLEQASAEFTGDECFEKWYQETKEALEKLIK